jgi:c-di-GMP-binding flagellar brake protein YcgR
MKLFSRDKTESQSGSLGLTTKQRVDLKIRGVGRTAGHVADVDRDAVLIELVVNATEEAVALQQPDAVLEYTTARGLYRRKGHAVFNGGGPGRVTFVGSEEPELVQRRDFVRVSVNMGVSLVVKDYTFPTDFDAINLSANGILLAPPPAAGLRLEIGMFVWLKIPLYDGKDRIDVRGSVVREAARGSMGVRFDHISESDQERLAHFVARQEREQRKRGAA